MALNRPPDALDGSQTFVKESGILKLPNELIENVVSYLPAYQVAKLGATCKQLDQAIRDDVHWKKRFLGLGLFHPGDSPLPFKTWRDLFLAHYPFWFIPQHRIWYADGTEMDGGFCGQLLIARYHPHTGNIEGYALTGERGQNHIYTWPEKPNVNIHSFRPLVKVHLAEPQIRLRAPKQDGDGYSVPGVDPYAPTETNNRGLKSLRPAGNDLNYAHHVFAQVMLARAIQPHLQHPSMRLWPPERLPAFSRVRRQTPSVFVREAAHPSTEARGTSFDRPTSHADVCQTAFRFQRQVGGRVAALFEMLNQGVITGINGPTMAMRSMATGVATYATLPEDAYRPTPERPYQGIWVGDYAGHGCEFLLVRQKVTREEVRASENFGPKHHHMGEDPQDEFLDEIFEGDTDSGGDDFFSADEGESDDQTQPTGLHTAEQELHQQIAQQTHSQTSQSAEASSSQTQPRPRKRSQPHSASRHEPDEPVGESGRLEAIKLTGDPNVPRGEFTFVAEEIGRKGEVYVAQGEPFTGKRAVQCWGHIAAHGFTDDVFVKTDLILVSHDTLAQHWHAFGHVAYYRRVDVDRFFDPLAGVNELRL